MKNCLFLLPLAALSLAGCSDGATTGQADARTSSAEVSGEASSDAAISGTIDGEAISWSLWTTQSDYTGDATNGTASFMGWKGKGPETFGHIAIGFELRNGKPVNPEISINDGDENRSFYLVRSSDDAITLSKAEKVGDVLNLSGMVSGRLGYSDDNGKTIASDRGHSVDFTFNISLEGLSH